MLTAIALSVSGYFVAKHEITKVCVHLEEIMYNTDTENDDEVFKKAEELIEKWQESNKILTIILRHSLSMEIQQNVLYMQNCIDNKDKGELIKACYDSHARLISVLQSEKPSLSNTF